MEEDELTLDDLRKRFVAAAAPEADLENFFSQWLDRMGAPVLEMQWGQVPGEGDSLRVSVVIKQVQEGEPFSLWLDLGVLSSAGVSTHRVEITEAVTKTSFPVEGPVQMLVLDPKNKLCLTTWRAPFPSFVDSSIVWRGVRSNSTLESGSERTLLDGKQQSCANSRYVPSFWALSSVRCSRLPTRSSA